MCLIKNERTPFFGTACVYSRRFFYCLIVFTNRGSMERYGQFFHVFFAFSIGDTVEVKKNKGHFFLAVETEQASVVLNRNSSGAFPGIIDDAAGTFAAVLRGIKVMISGKSDVRPVRRVRQPDPKTLQYQVFHYVVPKSRTVHLSGVLFREQQSRFHADCCEQHFRTSSGRRKALRNHTGFSV